MKIEGVPYRTPACDRHLSENESDTCPWCRIEELEALAEPLTREIYRATLDRHTVLAQMVVDYEKGVREIAQRLAEDVDTVGAAKGLFNMIEAINGNET